MTIAMAVLFMVGSACFALGALPGFASLVPAAVVGGVFFVGSIFFTAAGAVQFVDAHRSGAPVDRWAAGIQSIGTLWFNVNTFAALQRGLTARQQDLRIWTPDFLGSICFLVASELALWSVCRCPWCVRRDATEWWIAAINLLGSVFFMVSALAAFVLPDDDLLDASLANSGTLLGALCFFWAARLLLVPEPEIARSG